jgi:hypothetical protein
MQPKLSSSEGWRGKIRPGVVAGVIGAVCMGHTMPAPPKAQAGGGSRGGAENEWPEILLSIRNAVNKRAPVEFSSDKGEI